MENKKPSPSGPILAGLFSPDVQQTFQLWEQQKDEMAELVKSFWAEERESFIKFWTRDADEDVRLAMLEAALADVPDGFLGAIGPIVCPELSVERLPELTKSPVGLIRFYKTFSQPNMDDNVIPSVAELAGEEMAHQEAEKARGILLTARACVLLTVLSGIALIFLNR